MNSVIGIGNALVDVIIRMDNEELLSEISLPKGSMTMIDAVKADSILKLTSGIRHEKSSGGAVANTITGLARLGIRSGYIGKIGKDDTGNVFRENMEQAGINTHLLYGKLPTGRAITLVTPDGERTFGTYLGSAVDMQTSEVDPGILKNYRWMMAEGYLIYNHELITDALEKAKKAGMKIAMDMASYNLVEDNREFIKSLLEKYVDLVFANEMEARALTGFDDPGKALVAMAPMCDISVVKVGKDGSLIIRDNEKVEVKGIAADCIDTTGAGDLYAAGFLYGLLNGMDLSSCGKIGSILGGNAVEVVGAKIPDNRWVEIIKKINDINPAIST